MGGLGDGARAGRGEREAGEEADFLIDAIEDDAGGAGEEGAGIGLFQWPGCFGGLRRPAGERLVLLDGAAGDAHGLRGQIGEDLEGVRGWVCEIG